MPTAQRRTTKAQGGPKANGESRVLPQDLEAEAAVLGAMLLSRDAIVAAREIVSAQDFSRPAHGHIFDAATALHEAGAGVDPITVARELEGSGLLETVGGKPALLALQGATPSASNVAHYAAIVVHHSRRRRQIALGDAVVDAGYQGLDARQQVEALVGLDAPIAALSTWREIDLTDIEASADPPRLLRRDDGAALLYGGKLHLAFGEPEACKGWFVLDAAAQQIAEDHHVVYVDFEDSPAGIKERLSDLCVPTADSGRFHYLRPDERLDAAAQAELDRLLALDPTLVIVDGVTEAMRLHDLDLNDNIEIAAFFDLWKSLARRGPAVVLVDHVVKDREGRGRWAIGGQHKLAAVDGAAFSLEVISPFGRGRRGKVKVTVAKDRPGHVRALCEDGRRVAQMTLHSDPDGGVSIDLAVPAGTEETGPTYYMERISKVLEKQGPLSKRGIRGQVKGASDVIDSAIEVLANQGYIEIRKEGQSNMHRIVRPFREADEDLPGDPSDGGQMTWPDEPPPDYQEDF